MDNNFMQNLMVGTKMCAQINVKFIDELIKCGFTSEQAIRIGKEKGITLYRR